MRRGSGLAIAAASTAMVMTVLAGVGWGCTNLATITLSSEAGHPGDTIILTGMSFPVPRASSTLPPTPVVVYWKSLDGPVLATAVPDRTGMIAVTFTIPDSDPGPAVIIASQRRPVIDPKSPDTPPTLFTDEYGTPARATLRVLAPGERAGPVVRPGNILVSEPGGSSTAMIVMLVLFGAVSMSLFAGGVIAFLHQVRLRRMVAQPWRRR